MTNSITIFLVLLILTALGLDYMYNDLTASLFLARELTDMIEWMAFWR